MPEITKSIRYRVNVSTSVKGQKTWDCTVELTQGDEDMAKALSLSDALVAELDRRYPPLEVKAL